MKLIINSMVFMPGILWKDMPILSSKSTYWIRDGCLKSQFESDLCPGMKSRLVLLENTIQGWLSSILLGWWWLYTKCCERRHFYNSVEELKLKGGKKLLWNMTHPLNIAFTLMKFLCLFVLLAVLQAVQVHVWTFNCSIVLKYILINVDCWVISDKTSH